MRILPAAWLIVMPAGPAQNRCIGFWPGFCRATLPAGLYDLLPGHVVCTSAKYMNLRRSSLRVLMAGSTQRDAPEKMAHQLMTCNRLKHLAFCGIHPPALFWVTFGIVSNSRFLTQLSTMKAEAQELPAVHPCERQCSKWRGPGCGQNDMPFCFLLAQAAVPCFRIVLQRLMGSGFEQSRKALCTLLAHWHIAGIAVQPWR